MSPSPRVRTNHQLRRLEEWRDLPEKAQRTFGYLSDQEHFDARFVRYGGEWFDVEDTQRIVVAPEFSTAGVNVQPGHPLSLWHRLETDGLLGGVVFRWLSVKEARERDFDRDDYVIVGWYSA